MTEKNLDTPLHPRPQLTRDRWLDLSGPWQFAYDDANVGLRERWVDRPDRFDRTIIVPFPPESTASGIGDPSFHPVVWYRRTVPIAPEDQGRRLVLHFGAVDYRAQVWLNGHLVASHEGGHTPFSAEITGALDLDTADQVIVVRAEDQPDDLTQPRGKQYWEADPSRIWYHRTTGIWQPVWLEPLPEIAIAAVRWTPNPDRGLLGLTVNLDRRPDHPLRLRVRLSLPGFVLADDTYLIDRDELQREIAVDPGEGVIARDKLLWSPRHPNLIEAELTLLDGESAIDSVASYAGLRSVAVGNGRFSLNGRPFYLRLALEQGYWPESHLATPSSDALRREVELVKELGFNGVRIHQKIEDPRFLSWCDRLGVLVWGETANAYAFSPTAVEQLTREWLAAVRRDYSHPCIIAWVPFNESWGVPALERDPAQRAYVRALYHLTRALDPTRPVIGNDGWEHLVADIIGIHDYALDGPTLRERYGSDDALTRTLHESQPAARLLLFPEFQRQGEPVMLTEVGGIAYVPAAGENWYGYGSVGSEEEYLAKYQELLFAILDSPAIAGFCYTQLTDTLQETNGLLRADRTPKLDPAAIRAITARYSRAIATEVINQAQSAAQTSQISSAAIERNPDDRPPSFPGGPSR